MNGGNIFNFRELGGIPVHDGRKVRYGLFFRGGPLHEPNEKTKEMLDSFGLKHVVDMRSPSEVERGGDLYLPKGADYINISGLRDVDLDMIKGNNRNRWGVWMESLYQLLPLGNRAYQKLFDLIRKEEIPLYFHCSAGKDRTGVFAALLLKLLGADDETIIEEYMLSYDNMMRAIVFHPPVVNALVDPKWIREMFEEILKKYPDYDTYFLKEYGIDEERKNRIRNRCLIREG
ncbi:MAG: tyrosine-protein phosphatase [Erysipelotrichaceae bacterium]|nr:tyrosine-protein phosphatase [Erysipelotrichaceae bacterium]